MRQDFTHIAMILDRSGSMEIVKSDTIGGVNAFVDEQKPVPGDCTMTLVQFDDVIETVFAKVPIKQVPRLTNKTYKPRNSTALLDAIGKTVTDTGAELGKMNEADRPGKVVVVIVTDGMENASRNYTRSQIFDMIRHQRETYKWEFVFIGANMDAYEEARSMGIDPNNAMNYTANAIGTHALYASAGENLRMFRAGTKANMAWEDHQKKQQEDAKGS